MSNPYDNANERVSIIGPTLHFNGELSSDETLVIHGRVEGSITHCQRVTVGPKGVVQASIEAQTLVVEGTVDGNLNASKSVVVTPSAVVRGNVEAPSVSIQEGANFNGSVTMGSGPRTASGATGSASTKAYHPA